MPFQKRIERRKVQIGCFCRVALQFLELLLAPNHERQSRIGPNGLGTGTGTKGDVTRFHIHHFSANRTDTIHDEDCAMSLS